MQQRGAAALSYANSSTLSGHLVDWFLSASTSQSLTDWILVRCVSISRHISVTRRIAKALPRRQTCLAAATGLLRLYGLLMLFFNLSHSCLMSFFHFSHLFRFFLTFLFSFFVQYKNKKNQFEFLIARQVCAAVLQSTSVVSCANV